MGVFFIDTAQGTVATQRQLVDAGIAPSTGIPPLPWLRVQGTGDASTMWYAVMRKSERGVFIGTLVIRHSPHHALLQQSGWEEISPRAIGVGTEELPSAAGQSRQTPSG
ncbi:MAG TPA: hypothetical protein VNA28_17250 [Solirubrobacteraceae bacterium]|nr:hypothetical protein [Solirubrobacteraceae bacterium]